MRIIITLLLVVAGAGYACWTFVATFVWDSGSVAQFAFATAFGWLVLYDLWKLWLARAAPMAESA
jgi:hypothetical protein